MNLSDVNHFKVHPAIGVARLANNEDYFEFYEAHAKGFSPASDYMSGGGDNDENQGTERLKRQAVQFTVIAYGSNGEVLGKVHELFPDFTITWTAEVANRKLHNYTTKRGTNVIPPLVAKADASGPETMSNLDTKSPWDDSTIINFGTLTGGGLFIPPKGGVTRKSPTSIIDRYPANQGAGMNLETTDTTCDGPITVSIEDDAGNPVEKDVVPGWIVVAPPQHALTLTPTIVRNTSAMPMSDLFDPFSPDKNEDWLVNTKALLGIQDDLEDPTGLDTPMMETLNGEYKPGMEVNLAVRGSGKQYLETGLTSSDLFAKRGSDHVGQNEIRVKQRSGSEGAFPGQLTSGLCSTWQGDMVACLNYWTAENPYLAYNDAREDKVVNYDESDTEDIFVDTEEINTHMDYRGIVEHAITPNNKIEITIAHDPNRPSDDA